MAKIKVGIMGGAGYTGGELIRLLVWHPSVELVFVHSKSQAGKLVCDIHTDLLGDLSLRFTNQVLPGVDVVFLCVAHGEAKKLLSEYDFKPTVKIIDLSRDFRIGDEQGQSFVYGLPELNKKEIAKAMRVANPGCFATAIQLALLPLAKHKLLGSDIFISCTTGSTGAGQAFSETSHFSKRQNNHSVYKPFVHEHLAEIGQSVRKLQPVFEHATVMLPQRGSFTRGILASLSLQTNVDQESLYELFASYYATHPFVHLSKASIDLKQVVNTNKCVLYLEKHKNQLLIVSVIDNLLKGASGQAVQNMNLMFGLPESTGLKLKASAF